MWGTPVCPGSCGKLAGVDVVVGGCMGDVSVAQVAFSGSLAPLCLVAMVAQRPHDLGPAARIVARMRRSVSNRRGRQYGFKPHGDVRRHARFRPTMPRTGETAPPRVRASHRRDQIRPPGPPRFSQLTDGQESRNQMLKHNVASALRGVYLTLTLGAQEGLLPGPWRPVAAWMAFRLAAVVTSLRIEVLWATRGAASCFPEALHDCRIGALDGG